ncbi:MAG: ABC transporter permease subunit [Ignavibacteriales bacterium]|nr:ABC transporter permease subunit [Ignavibacteriales bacterium]
MRNVVRIVIKEFHQFRRDPKMFGIILVAPVLQLIVLGYAATLDVESARAIVLDLDRSARSRELIERFRAADFFETAGYVESYDELERRLDLGDAMFAIVAPKGFERAIERGETATLQAIFDGSDGNAVMIASGYLSRLVAAYSEDVLVERSLRGGGAAAIGAVVPEPRVWYNPELESRYFMVPGVVGLLLSLITLVLTSLAVVKEKEVGTLEQLIVTPIKPFELMVGKITPFIILGFAAVVVVLGAMWIVFGIEVRGSLWFLFLASFFYIFSTLGIGLLVSTFSKTQQQAMMIAIFLGMLPMVFLSGFAFPIENMPEAAQAASVVIPLKYFMTIIRSVILKEAGFAELWREAAALLGMGVAILALASLRFRKRID